MDSDQPAFDEGDVVSELELHRLASGCAAEATKIAWIWRFGLALIWH